LTEYFGGDRAELDVRKSPDLSGRRLVIERFDAEEGARPSQRETAFIASAVIGAECEQSLANEEDFGGELTLAAEN
jgi:hypothetical protein